MNTAVILAVLCFACVAAHRGFMKNKEVADAFEKCKGSGTGSGEEPEEANDTNCMAGCMGKELRVLNDGKVDIERLRELLNSSERSRPEKTEKIIADMEKCQEESELSEDNCVVARNYWQCMHRLRPRGGPHHRPDDE